MQFIRQTPHNLFHELSRPTPSAQNMNINMFATVLHQRTQASSNSCAYFHLVPDLFFTWENLHWFILLKYFLARRGRMSSES